MLLIIELVILIVVSLTISICSFLQKGPLISLIYYTSNKEERIRLKTKKRYYFIGSIFLVASILFGIILAEKIFNLPSMQKPLILISIILSTYFVIRYSQLELERMKNKEYKKTYKPLVAWLVIYPLVNIIIIMAIDRLFQLPKKMSVKASVLFSLIFMVFSLYILMFIIYKGEYVYWINGGPSFKEAQVMTSGERKEYARKYLDIFLKMMVRTFSYGLISLVLNLPSWLDGVLITIYVVVTCFSTMWIKYK